MAFCTNCGTRLEEGASFCPQCGTKTGVSQGQTGQAQNPNANAYTNYNTYNTPNPGYSAPNTSGAADPRDIEENKGLAWLAYLGILFFIPLVARPNSKYCRFHANQGLVLLLMDIAVYIAAAILSALLIAISWTLYTISGIIYFLASMAVLAFSIIGIVNALGGKQTRLPLIGKIDIIK